MKCGGCGQDVPEHVDRCPVCGRDVGFPNVRAAEQDDERAALDDRYRSASEDAVRRGCQEILTNFEKAVRTSKAVFCRSLGVASEPLSSEQALFATFYSQIRAGARLPEDNEFDRMRGPIDQTLFPYYAEKERGQGPAAITEAKAKRDWNQA